MENSLQSVPSSSAAAAAALEAKTLGVSATRYYRPEPSMGFTPYAELWNGRLAMLGIFDLLREKNEPSAISYLELSLFYWQGQWLCQFRSLLNSIGMAKQARPQAKSLEGAAIYLIQDNDLRMGP